MLRGERYGGKETDIWALGVLAYVILCGEVRVIALKWGSNRFQLAPDMLPLQCPFWSSEESIVGLSYGTRAETALREKSKAIQETISPSMRNLEQKILDAIDFVHQCLQTHARDRPSAVHLKQHCLFVTDGGWRDMRGWELAAYVEGKKDNAGSP